MLKYEYKVVPAPKECLSRRNIGDASDPVIATLETVMNDLGVAGWEYVRSESVSMRPAGILGRGRAMSQDILVFRRSREPLGAGLPTIEEDIARTKRRKSSRPELLALAKEGRRKVIPMMDDTADGPKPEKPMARNGDAIEMPPAQATAAE
ncbi:MAG: DUF4177 domain-containing protein [Pseudomonadota bacterium]